MDQISKIAAQTYAASKPATAASESRGDSMLGAFAADFASTVRQSEQIAMQAMTGGADPHALVEALAQTELAVETAVTIRDKVVEAYQEILRMPV